MSKENAENTPSFNHKDGKDESSDSDDLDERPTEVFRKVLSENLISPTNTPTRGLPSVSRKSSSPKINNAALPGHQRQSTSSSGEDQTSYAASSHKPQSTHSSSADQTTNAAFGGQSTHSSGADQTYANSQAVESTSEQIGDGSTSALIDQSTIDSRTLKTCNSEKDASTKGTKITDTSEPLAYTGVEIIVQSNASNPMKDSPLVFLSSTAHDAEISSSPAQSDQLVDFVADDASLTSSSSKQSQDSLGTCRAEENASTKRTNIIETSDPSSYTAVKVIVPSNTSDPKDPPLVFVSSTGYEEEISSQEQKDQLSDFAADVLLSDSSSKQVTSSAESEDSDDVGMYEFPSQPSQRFTTPEALEEEIRSVFEMISSYVNTEINKTRTKRETLQINLSRRRAFVRHPLSQTLGQFSAVSRRIASELLSTLTEHEGLEFTYQGPPRINDQLAFRCLIQESAQYFGHESYGILSRGSYGACCQQSSESQEPTEESSQAFSERSGQASSRLDPSSLRLTQTSLEGLPSSTQGLVSLPSKELAPSPSSGLAPSPSRGLAPSSSSGLAPSSSSGLAPSPSSGLAPSPSSGLAPSPSSGLAPSRSRGLAPSPSEELTPSSSGVSAEASSMVVANPDLSRTSELSEFPGISRLFSRGYSIGLEIGSESYARRVSGRALQSRFGQMIQDLQQHPEVQTQGIPQELFDLASRMIFLLSPRTTHWLNTSVPRNIAQTYFIGLFVGFSRAFSQWSGRRQVFGLPSRSVPRLFNGLPSNLHRALLLMTQRSLQGSLTGTHQRFPHGSSTGISNTPIARFSRSHSLFGPSAHRPFRDTVRGHGSEPRSSLSSRSKSTRPSDRERPANIQGRIHVLLTQLVLDLNMIRALADLISREYRSSGRNFERISSYLLCFEIMREDYREKESRYVDLEREISSDVQRYRREAFAILHIELLIDILEHCISRVQYGAMLVRTHERLGEVRTISDTIRRVARTAMSYEMWTKED